MVATKFITFLLLMVNIGFANAQNATTIYLIPYTGSDNNIGTIDKPLKTLVAAARFINESTSNDPMTIILSEGIML